MIIYKGPSLIDDEPIVAIAITKSKNVKTGNIIQTYILREDIDPITANRTGLDYSICGGCDLRGTPNNKSSGLASGRKCYVQIGQAPRQIYQAYKLGKYPVATNLIEIGKGRVIRIGSYGDGAAVPKNIWDELTRDCISHTAYTHNHGDPEFYMKSVETLQEAEWNWLSGYRTFRVVKSKDEIVKNKEILCPADGVNVTCSSCKLCGGSAIKAKSIAIEAHGSGLTYFK
jgi:hypothetical protein